MSEGNFFAELKRRNVYKVAVAYAVVSWLLIQAASIFLPAFDAPIWSMKALILVLVLGFPVALVLSWAFEITPEGIKLESEIARNQSITHHTGRKIVALTITVAIAAAGLFAYQLISRTGTGSSSAGTGPVSHKSIAVLPFDNLSHEADNAYFCEGVQDEILTRLAKAADIKVISRTSTQHFKSAPDNLREIAKQLGVAHILEGSVQKAGDQVRVNVQLIKAASDTHLWAETYDRKLTDIFAVESEIARTVADTLKARLSETAEHVLASKPTENPEAYQLYLQGRYLWNRRTTENIQKAAGYFEQAIAKDPGYALAYAGLGDCYGLFPIYADTAPLEDIHRAEAVARRALALDDSLAEAHTSLANALAFDLRFAEAEKEFKRAIELNPNYATAHQWYSENLAGLGRFDEALREAKLAHDLDPLSLIINCVYGLNLHLAGKSAAGVEQLKRTLELDPNFGVAYVLYACLLEDKGDLPNAIMNYERAVQLLPNALRKMFLLNAYMRVGRKDEARAIFDEYTKRAATEYVQPYALAIMYLNFGDREKALQLLQKAYDDRAIIIGGTSGSLKIDKRLDPLRDDARFQKLLAQFMGETK